MTAVREAFCDGETEEYQLSDSFRGARGATGGSFLSAIGKSISPDCQRPLTSHFD